MEVNNIGRRIFFPEVITDCMHQMGLTQTYTAVDEQGVVSTSRITGYLSGCRPSQLVGFTLDKIGKGVVLIEFSLEAEFTGRIAEYWGQRSRKGFRLHGVVVRILRISRRGWRGKGHSR